jgi:hypothetical protein
LQQSLQIEKEYQQYIGSQLYRLQKEHIPFDDLFSFFYLKKKSFQYEGECIITDIGESEVKINEGLKINIDINTLIEKITFTQNPKTGIKIW